MKKFKHDNPSYHREQNRRWSRANPEKIRLRSLARRARHLGNGGTFTLQEWVEIKRYYKFTCLRCRLQEPEIKLTVDHIVPASKGGRHSIENIQPLCRSCNSIKQAQTIDYRPLWEEEKMK
ncbi:MAG: HNH endonuclease [Candidatus Viridilinea halotolerans]|uniref:HNH endonuclease n=1 Tax=Candidatus Viridilinea halotolerans TaxID=2491704 RepID=A0A426TQN9_9CHLR|nr:MAG: HNH endonuclease [Candidatus Viridilinea halotolerans]